MLWYKAALTAYIAKDGYSMKTKQRPAGRKLRRLEVALMIGLAAALAWGAWSLGTQRQLADRVVRLHVLANSDSEADQALKLTVRDRILEVAEPLLETAADREEARTTLEAALPELERAAEATIAAEGYDYGVTASLEETEFPTREYDGFALPAGEYLALRVVIGAGEGQNWWCVVFPPLCAAASADVPEVAVAAGLSQDQVSLITEADQGYQLKFKAAEWWNALRQKLEG